MTVTVYVWNLSPRSVGHAAMQVKSPSRSFDLSWHPTSNGKRNLSERSRKILDGLRSAGRLEDLDEELEKNPADHTISLLGLDEAAMVRWWDSQPNQHYSIFTRNCARLVADGLVAGGAGQVIGSPLMRWHVAGQRRWWWPYEIKRFARETERWLGHEGTPPISSLSSSARSA